MSLLASLLALTQVIQVPAYSPPDSPLSQPADASQLSLVIATTGQQGNPQRLCQRADCTSLFQVRFSKAKTVAGIAMPKSFKARMEMGSPFDQPYRLALVIEQRPDREPLVRATRGFHYQTGIACFSDGELRGIDWKPQGSGITYQNGILCVSP